MPKKAKRSTRKKRQAGTRKAQRKAKRKQNLTKRVVQYDMFVNKNPRKGLITSLLGPDDLVRFSTANKNLNKTLKNYNFRKNLIDKSRNLDLYLSPPQGLVRQHAMRWGDTPPEGFNRGRNKAGEYYEGPTDLSPESLAYFGAKKSKKRRKRKKRRKTKRKK